MFVVPPCFPFLYILCLKSILAGAWSPSLDSTDGVFYVITNDPAAFLSLVKNGRAPIFLGLTTSGGPIAQAENGWPFVFIGLVASNGRALVFVGLVASCGPTTLAENCQNFVFVGLVAMGVLLF